MSSFKFKKMETGSGLTKFLINELEEEGKF